MQQVSRKNSLKIPKQLELFDTVQNSIEDKVETKKALLMAENKKIKEAKIKKGIEEDKDLKQIEQIPSNANDLIVITMMKKLSAYVIAITEKSPKKFRGVFVNRMQNYCLDALENLLQANFIRMDSIENKRKREEYQKETILKLKLLSYISMLAEASGCILKKQYKQISIQLSEVINLTIAWKKSDDARWKTRN